MKSINSEKGTKSKKKKKGRALLSPKVKSQLSPEQIALFEELIKDAQNDNTFPPDNSMPFDISEAQLPPDIASRHLQSTTSSRQDPTSAGTSSSLETILECEEHESSMIPSENQSFVSQGQGGSANISSSSRETSAAEPQVNEAESISNYVENLPGSQAIVSCNTAQQSTVGSKITSENRSCFFNNNPNALLSSNTLGDDKIFTQKELEQIEHEAKGNGQRPK